MLLTSKNKETIKNAINKIFSTENKEKKINHLQKIAAKLDLEDVQWFIGAVLSISRKREKENWGMHYCQEFIQQFYMNKFTHFSVIAENSQWVQALISHLPNNEEMMRAAGLFALIIADVDNFLKLNQSIDRPQTSQEESLQRFLTIASKLPMELQMLLCLRTVGLASHDIITQSYVDPAFRWAFSPDQTPVKNSLAWIHIETGMNVSSTKNHELTQKLLQCNKEHAVFIALPNTIAFKKVVDYMPNLKEITFAYPGVKALPFKNFNEKIKVIHFLFDIKNQYATYQEGTPTKDISTLKFWSKHEPDLYFWENKSAQFANITPEKCANLSAAIEHLLVHEKPSFETLNALPEHIKTVQYYEGENLYLVEIGQYTHKVLNDDHITFKLSLPTLGKNKESLVAKPVLPSFSALLESLSEMPTASLPPESSKTAEMRAGMKRT